MDDGPGPDRPRYQAGILHEAVGCSHFNLSLSQLSETEALAAEGPIRRHLFHPRGLWLVALAETGVRFRSRLWTL